METRNKAGGRDDDDAESYHRKCSCTNHDGETEQDDYGRRRIDDDSTRVVTDLPLDIVCKILSMLTFKPLARFRSVSKSWNSSIQNPYFNDLCSKSKPPGFIFSKDFPRDLGKINFCIVEKQKDEYWENTLIPLESTLQDLGLEVVATCNGLLCLMSYTSLLFKFGENIQIYIYNPITRENITLPIFHFAREEVYEGMQLGYDVQTEKYKFMLIRRDLGVDIITVGENHWRKCSLPKELLWAGAKYVDIYNPIFVKGEMYWIVEKIDGGSKYVVLAMDISNEKTRIINIIDPPPTSCYLLPFQNHVSLILKMSTDPDTEIQIWDLVDNKNGIWRHRASINHDLLHLSDSDKVTALRAMKDEDVLFGITSTRGLNRLYSYNLDSKKLTLQSFKDDVIPNCSDLFSFMPSLVSIKL